MSTGEEVTNTPTEATTATPKTTVAAPKRSLEEIVKLVSQSFTKSSVTNFSVGDSVRVHAKIIEGNKERIQVFEGVVIKRSKGNHTDATFTVRKVSYNIGVERTFPLHSPRVERVELVSRAKVRRARLFYLRPLRGKATRMKTIFERGDRSNETAAAS